MDVSCDRFVKAVSQFAQEYSLAPPGWWRKIRPMFWVSFLDENESEKIKRYTILTCKQKRSQNISLPRIEPSCIFSSLSHVIIEIVWLADLWNWTNFRESHAKGCKLFTTKADIKVSRRLGVPWWRITEIFFHWLPVWKNSREVGKTTSAVLRFHNPRAYGMPEGTRRMVWRWHHQSFVANGLWYILSSS